MRRLFAIMGAALFLLSGCAAKAAPTWESVDDTMDQTAASWMEQAYTVDFEVPADAAAEELDGTTRRVYQQKDGDYEIIAQTMLAADLGTVTRAVSGFEPDQLQIMETDLYGMPQYQFAWYASGEEGGTLNRTRVLLEEPYGYVLTFSVREGLGTEYDATAERVMSTMSLFYDEGF